MAETSKISTTEDTQNLSEADRMARIRDLLVGPVIADEQVRQEKSVGRLNDTLAEQSETIAALKARIDALETDQRAETERLDLRLLGILDALLADEQVLRNRLANSDRLKSYFGDVAERAGGLDKSD